MTRGWNAPVLALQVARVSVIVVVVRLILINCHVRLRLLLLLMFLGSWLLDFERRLTILIYRGYMK